MSEQTGYEGDEAQPMSPDRAYVESAEHSLNGLKLQPFTIERQWAADAMRLRWGHLPEGDAKQFNKAVAEKRTPMYPGMAGDTAIVMWLCSIDKERVKSARHDPAPAEEEAIEFAKEHKIASPKQKTFWPAYLIFLDIMSEVHASYAEPDVEKKTEIVTTTK